MTAKFPPMPLMRLASQCGISIGASDGSPYPTAEQLTKFAQSYAKLAVREALLGIIRKSISHNWIEPSDDGNIVTIPESVLRAMIEEYNQ